jgi:hypothetical protein
MGVRMTGASRWLGCNSPASNGILLLVVGFQETGVREMLSEATSPKCGGQDEPSVIMFFVFRRWEVPVFVKIKPMSHFYRFLCLGAPPAPQFQGWPRAKQDLHKRAFISIAHLHSPSLRIPTLKLGVRGVETHT